MSSEECQLSERVSRHAHRKSLVERNRAHGVSEKNIFPYIENIRKSLSVGKYQKSLLIFDVFKGQTTGAVSQLLEENHCLSVKVPANHTDLFQPLDLTVNKPAKACVSNKYQQWYADKVLKQLSQGVTPHDVKVDVKLSIVKPLHAEWVVVCNLLHQRQSLPMASKRRKYEKPLIKQNL